MAVLKKTAQLSTIIFAFALLIYAATPFLCNRYLLPKVVAQLPFSLKELTLETISLHKMVASLRLAGQKNSVNLPQLTLHYSPASLFSGKINKVTINGLTLRLQVKDGKLLLPEISQQTQQNNPQQKKTKGLTIPVNIGKIILQECTILLEECNRFHTTLLAVGEIRPKVSSAADNTLATLEGDLQLAGDIAGKIELSIKNLDAETVTLKAKIKTQLHRLTDTFDLPCQLTGNMVATATAQILRKKDEYTLQEYRLQLASPNISLSTETINLNNSEKKPFSVSITGDSKVAHFEASNMALTTPAQLATEVAGDIFFSSNSQKIQGTATLHTAFTALPARLDFTATKQGEKSHIAATLTGEKLKIESYSLPSLHLEAIAEINKNRTFGRIKGKLPKLSLPQIELTGGQLDFPFQYPYQKKKNAKGQLVIQSIHYQQEQAGRLTVELQQSKTGMHTNLLFTTPLLEAARLKCTTDIIQSPFSIQSRCHLPWAKFDSDRLPASMRKKFGLNKTSITTKIGAKSELNFTNKKLNGTVRLSVADGKISQEETLITGIYGAITLPDVNHLQSSPDQRITIKEIHSGKIHTQNGKIRWRLERPDSLFIESIQLNWCGGMVETGSLRLGADTKELVTTLYCDRLDLTKLLDQFGVAEASGEVSLNGRIPVVFSDSNIKIDNGFLFTTPGETGVLHFTNTKQIRANIPTIQTSAYITYSLDSLKDFAYNWVKLTFNSEKEGLLMQMQLDGKPAQPLPYAYKKGRIVPATGETGLQHPVRFDVNFHLPLQQIIQYGAGFQSIMGSFKEGF